MVFDTDKGKFYLEGDEYTDQENNWDWDPYTRTLTLDGFEWTTTNGIALLFQGDDFTLNLKGDNVFVSTYSGDYSSTAVFIEGLVSDLVTITGDGTLTATCKDGLDSMGIFVETSNLIIESGTINAVGGYAGISGFGNMTLSGGSVSASGGNTGIYYFGNMTLSGGSVSASGDSKGIYCFGNMTVSGGSVSASGGDHGLHCVYNMTVSGGSVSASSEYDIGIYCYSNMTLSGGSVIASGGTVGIDCSDIDVTASNYIYWVNSAPTHPGGKGSTYPTASAFVNSESYKYVKIQTVETGSLVFDTDEGKFYLDGDVYEEQENNWDWDPDTRILTLDDFEWTTTNETALLILGDNFTINLEGDNVFVSIYFGASDFAAISIEGSGSDPVTITGDGTLTATSEDNLKSTGLYVEASDLIIESGTINAVGKYSGIDCNDMTVSGGSVSASGGLVGIDCYDMTLSGGSVSASGDYTGIYCENALSITATNYTYWVNTSGSAHPGGEGSTYPTASAFVNEWG